MHDQAAKAARFLALHQGERPLLLANAWDAGSAKLLAWLGFEALATTSSGSAASLGRPDYGVSRDEALAHCAALVVATELPVSADLENGFAEDPAGVAETVRLAGELGLAGCSIEDWSSAHRCLYGAHTAAERVAAAAEAAHSGPARMVLTARAENYLRGNRDLDDTIARLQAFQEAGADVLYAPALDSPEHVRRLLAARRSQSSPTWASGACPSAARLRWPHTERRSGPGGNCSTTARTASMSSPPWAPRRRARRSAESSALRRVRTIAG